uniref:Uncharacterized protein n=1 Tax=Anguilla anguilla TaxID=7936 RepID=A0A0E9UZY4_ANGAN
MAGIPMLKSGCSLNSTLLGGLHQMLRIWPFATRVFTDLGYPVLAGFQVSRLPQFIILIYTA